MKTPPSPSVAAHLRCILLLPTMVTIIIPIAIYYLSDDNLLFDWLHDYKTGFRLVGILFFIIGMILFITTLRLFHRRGKGTLAPWDPPKKLVIEGSYRYVRNPMITGINAILLAEALLIPSAYILLWQIFFFSLNHIYFIWKEEPDLIRRFGADYERYQQQVPRWIPRWKAWYSKQEEVEKNANIL